VLISYLSDASIGTQFPLFLIKVSDRTQGSCFDLCRKILSLLYKNHAMAELDNNVYEQIQKLTEAGDIHAENENYSEALDEYWKAFDLVPEPKTNWEATTWILVAIGDANFLGQDYQAGVDNLSNAMHCPGAIGNPFIHMRLGQCQFEVGNMERAADELTRAYALEGEEIFSADDPKYLQFLKTKIQTDRQEKKPWWKF